MDSIPAADHDDEETQVERANRLADILDDSGWDGIAAIHLLDCLAGTGLKLVADPEGECSEAYVELLQGDLVQMEAARADIAAGTTDARAEILASPTAQRMLEVIERVQSVAYWANYYEADGWWMAEFPALEVVTQARTLPELRDMARDLLTITVQERAALPADTEPKRRLRTIWELVPVPLPGD